MCPAGPGCQQRTRRVGAARHYCIPGAGRGRHSLSPTLHRTQELLQLSPGTAGAATTPQLGKQSRLLQTGGQPSRHSPSAYNKLTVPTTKSLVFENCQIMPITTKKSHTGKSHCRYHTDRQESHWRDSPSVTEVLVGPGFLVNRPSVYTALLQGRQVGQSSALCLHLSPAITALRCAPHCTAHCTLHTIKCTLHTRSGGRLSGQVYCTATPVSTTLSAAPLHA